MSEKGSFYFMAGDEVAKDRLVGQVVESKKEAEKLRRRPRKPVASNPMPVFRAQGK